MNTTKNPPASAALPEEADLKRLDWKVIDSYFKDNASNLVAHHLDSYNDFMNYGLRRIFVENNPVRFIERDGRPENRNECKLYLGGKDGSKIYFGKPVIYDETRTHYMYPNDARMRNMTYGVSVHYEVDVEFIYYINDVPHTRSTTIPGMRHLGKMPVMLNSNLCILNGLSRETKFNMGECKNDYGGYFIIDGKEKVIVSQEKFANNMVYVKKYNGDDTYSYSADIRSVSEDSSKQIRTTSVRIVSGGLGDSGSCGIAEGSDSNNSASNASKAATTTKAYSNNHIVVLVPNVRTPVPLFILMRALGVISDRDIIDTCLLGIERNADMVELFRPSIHDANRVYTQQTALEFIKTFTKINSVSGVLEILSDYFLPHIGEINFVEKAYFIGSMVKKMLLASTGQSLPTDRDNFRYKRVDTSGALLYDLTREFFLLQKKHITQKLGIEYNNNPGIYVDTIPGSDNGEVPAGSAGARAGADANASEGDDVVKRHMFYDLIMTESTQIEAFKEKILEKGVMNAFKGKWGSQSYTTRVGLVQGLDRLSWYAHVHALRKLNLPLDASAKVIGPRKLHASQWGIVDPIDTPDGGHVGLHKQMTIFSHITSGYPVAPLIEWLYAHAPIKKILNCSPSYLGTVSKVIVNGQWIGVVVDPLDMVRKLKVCRRNGIIPVFTSITFDHKTEEVTIYTDAGRLTRPIYPVEYNAAQTAVVRRPGVERLLADGRVPWEQIVSGFHAKAGDAFHHKHNNLFSPAQLYPDVFRKTDGPCLPDEAIREIAKSGSVVEYMDSSEAEPAMIAISRETLADALAQFPSRRYTHVEIDPSALLGMLSNQTIFADHNPLSRNLFSCGQAKQASSLYHSNYQMRMDKMGLVLNYGQTPIVKSRYLKYVNNEEHPSGVNTIVAIMAYTGYNVEDAILVNRGAIDRGLFRTTYLTSYETKEESLAVSGEVNSRFANIEDTGNVSGLKRDYDYSMLDSRGVIRENTPLTDKTILVGKISNALSSEEWTDDSLKTKRGQLGMVDKTFVTEGEEGFNIAKVRVREDRIPAIGDKMVSRAGQKGTIGLIIPEKDMPFTADGMRPDLIINPHALPSRMTIGQLIESVLGTLCVDHGGFGDCTVFQGKGSKLDVYGKLLVDAGFHSQCNHLMYDGMSGEQIQADVFMGPTYYTRLKHMVKDKVNFRARGKRDMLTRQTNQGRADEGGLRIGEMERDGVIGHGMMAFLSDSFLNRGDEYFVGVCDTTGAIAVYNEATNVFFSPAADGPIHFHVNPDSTVSMKSVSVHGRTFSLTRIPYAFKLLLQELQAMNVHMRIVTENNINQLTNMSGSTNISTLLKMDETSDDFAEVHKAYVDRLMASITGPLPEAPVNARAANSGRADITADASAKTTAGLKIKYDLSKYPLSYSTKIDCAKKSNIIPAMTDPAEFHVLFGDESVLPSTTRGAASGDAEPVETRPPELDLPIYANLTKEDIFNTFDYMFYHIRIGIYVQIKNGRLEYFIPFHNQGYTNNWPASTLTFSDGKGGTTDMDQYYKMKKKQKYKNTDVERNTEKWSANNCLIGTWSDNEIGNMGWFEVREMIHEACQAHAIGDCSFFVNRRDHPVLTPNGMEPYFHIYDGLDTPLPDRHRHAKFAPILGFSKNDSFADLLIPNYADWRNITKRLYPTNCASMEEDDITLDWDAKKSVAVFRGSATGCGNTPEDNQRIQLAQMAKQDEAVRGNASVLDAGLVGMSARDKKVQGKPVDFFRHKNYDLSKKSFMSMNAQSTYKYIIHVDGHVSAYRLGKELSLGSAILKVDSAFDYKLWFDQFMAPNEHYVPIHKNLDNLISTIEESNEDDSTCRAVAANALALHGKIMSREFVSKYWADTMNAISANFV